MILLPDHDRLALLSAIVDSSDAAIISKTLEGIITSWNKSAESLFGYSASEAIGQSVTILIPPDRLNEEPEIISRLKRGERVDHFETTRRRKDGRLIDMSLTISPVLDANGTIIGASKIARDITEAKKITTELQRANAVLEQFAYSASHDLQEPVRAVRIHCQLLRRKHSDLLGPDGVAALGFLESGSARMQALLRDLLAYAHVTKCEAPNEDSDLNVALDDVLSALGDTISETSARVIIVNPLPSLRMHAAHLQQIFQNLIGNALKYRNPDVPPLISVGAKRQDSYWQISVEDNGIGVEAANAEAVFVIFKRLHSPEEYPGTGLGLAICQRIIDQYDGRIWVEPAPLMGSIFRFNIPD